MPAANGAHNDIDGPLGRALAKLKNSPKDKELTSTVMKLLDDEHIKNGGGSSTSPTNKADHSQLLLHCCTEGNAGGAMLLLEHSYLGYKLNSDYVGFADLDGESSAAAKPNGAAANGGANGGGGRRRATPLIAAAHRGLSQVVQRLLSSPHNADPSVDCDGVTARDVAAAPPKLNGVNGAANKPDPKLKGLTPTEDLRDRRAICLQVLDDHRKVQKELLQEHSSSGSSLSPLKGKTVGELQDALRSGALSPPTQGVRSSTTGGQVSDLILGTPHQLGEQHPHAHIMDVASMGGCSSSSNSSHSSSSAAAKAAAAGVGLGPQERRVLADRWRHYRPDRRP